MSIKIIIMFSIFFITMGLFFQNCGKPLNLDLNSRFPDLESSYALVYGESEEDQNYLNDKVKGYLPPKMKDIFHRWGTFSNDSYFNNYSSIQLPSSLKYCTSGGRDKNGGFLKVNDPADGTLKNPTNITACMNSKEFNALTWTVLNSPERVFTPMNSNYFIGFISPSSFDDYEHEMTLTSTHQDDDAIMSIIAFDKDDLGNINILTAIRNQGGFISEKGWLIAHYKNGVIIKVFEGPQIDATLNKNVTYKTDTTGKYVLDGAGKKIVSDSGSGDTKGWNGRKTRVKIVRNGNLIKAYASSYKLSTETVTSMDIKENSLIELDLNDPTNELEIFKGKKPYGYGTLSQANSSYLDDIFKSNLEDELVYDLKSNNVYEHQSDGSYKLIGNDAKEKLGFPKKISNPETGRSIYIEWNKNLKYLNE